MGIPIAENPFLPPAESQRQPRQVRAMLEQGVLLVDVREIGEFAEINPARRTLYRPACGLWGRVTRRHPPLALTSRPVQGLLQSI